MLLAHLSDTHFTVGPLAGAPADRGYQALLRVQGLDPVPDCVIITGDLTDSGSIPEYELAKSILDKLDIPVHVIPGNHDDSSNMLSVLGGTRYVKQAVGETNRCYYTVSYPGYRVLCLDSSVPGRHDGELGMRQLEWLDRELGSDPVTPTLLAMHHHPVASGIDAMDRIMLTDAAALQGVLLRNPPVARILIGHLHRSVTATFGGALMTVAPSTYRQVQLTLGPSARETYVEEPPAFLLHFLVDHDIVTHLVPIAHSDPSSGRVRSNPISEETMTDW
jgi:3',5'-cyclic-AMP phosphodiesterase